MRVSLADRILRLCAPRAENVAWDMIVCDARRTRRWGWFLPVLLLLPVAALVFPPAGWMFLYGLVFLPLVMADAARFESRHRRRGTLLDLVLAPITSREYVQAFDRFYLACCIVSTAFLVLLITSWGAGSVVWSLLGVQSEFMPGQGGFISFRFAAERGLGVWSSGLVVGWVYYWITIFHGGWRQWLPVIGGMVVALLVLMTCACGITALISLGVAARARIMAARDYTRVLADRVDRDLSG